VSHAPRPTLQAQGLAQLMGGREVLAGLLSRHGVLLAAHGPYTAQGVSEVRWIRRSGGLAALA
jgi:hypothetical protein